MKHILVALTLIMAAIIAALFPFGILSRTNSIDALTNELGAKTARLLDTYAVPGAAIAVVEDGQVKWVGAFGLADIAQQTGISEQTVFQVASVSKSVAALAVMKLVEDGKIHLEDPAEHYLTRWRLPESAFDSQEVTIRRLLSHSAGLTLHGYPGYHPQTELPTLEASLSGTGLATPGVTLADQPGAAFRYSGGGFTLLELIVEEVTGMRFADYADTEILLPLGMNNSSFEWRPHLQANTAQAYDKDLNVLPNYLFTEKAAAGLYSTIGDLSRFMIAEYDSYRGQGLLSRQTMADIYRPVIEVGGRSSFVYQHSGLGHFINATPHGTILVTHDGGNEGWRSNFTLIPETGHGIVILTNGNNGHYLISEVLDAWHHALFQAPRFPVLNRIGSSIHSLTAVLFVWSGIAAITMAAAWRTGARGLALGGARGHIAVRGLSICVLVIVVAGVATIVVPLLGFLGPRIGLVLLSAVATRALVGIIEVLMPRKQIGKVIQTQG
jgi:CubicO group peptidase (beta-lactamase class C family)